MGWRDNKVAEILDVAERQLLSGALTPLIPPKELELATSSFLSTVEGVVVSCAGNWLCVWQGQPE